MKPFLVVPARAYVRRMACFNSGINGAALLIEGAYVWTRPGQAVFKANYWPSAAVIGVTLVLCSAISAAWPEAER